MKLRTTWALVLVACAAPTTDPTGGDDSHPKNPNNPSNPTMTADAGTTDPMSDGGGTPGPDSGWISGGGTGFYSPMGMFNGINMLRQQYANHIPYDGYPFMGNNANAMTWSTQLAWDAQLAKVAQDEADRLANGGKPTGQYFPFMNDPGEGFYIQGLDSPYYMIATRADAALQNFKDAYGNLQPPHHAFTAANGFFRMAVCYQTGSGNYNKKSKLGVGATEGGSYITWWVLVFQ